MKIYVAGKFENKELILNTYKKLKEMGHSISYDWTTHKNIKPYFENKDIASEYAQNELNGLLNSDILIYFSNETGHTLFMEFGAALALLKTTGKPKIYAVGEFNDCSPWFFNPIVERCENIEQALIKIGEI